MQWSLHSYCILAGHNLNQAVHGYTHKSCGFRAANSQKGASCYADLSAQSLTSILVSRCGSKSGLGVNPEKPKTLPNVTRAMAALIWTRLPLRRSPCEGCTTPTQCLLWRKMDDARKCHTALVSRIHLGQDNPSARSSMITIKMVITMLSKCMGLTTRQTAYLHVCVCESGVALGSCTGLGMHMPAYGQ